MGGRGTSSNSRSTIAKGSGSFSSGMAGSGRGNVKFQMQQNPPKQAPTPQAAVQANNSVFPDTDNTPYHQLYNGAQYYAKQNFTVSQMMAIMEYIDPDTVPGSLYSASQNLNTAMMTGRQLDPQQAYVATMMQSAMHNLGYNVNLTRYDHGSFADRLLSGTGIDFNKAPIAQLQKTLVGTSFSENRFLSTSYNDFKYAPSNNPFKDRQIKITYRAKAGVQSLMPGDTTNKSGVKLRWGEIIVAPNTPQKVVAVNEISKNGARKQGTPSGSKGARQIEIVIELG